MSARRRGKHNLDRLAAAIVRRAVEDRDAARDGAWAENMRAETGYPLEEFRSRWPGLGRRELVQHELDVFFASDWCRDLLSLMGRAAAAGPIETPLARPRDRRRGRHPRGGPMARARRGAPATGRE